MERVISGIEKTADVSGGDACVAGTRIPVWILEQARRHGASEGDLLADYPSLTAADLATSWEYVSANRAEVETVIQENEDA